jgi:hypothetical protein
MAGLAAALALAACGGGTPQDAHEPSGSFPVQVTEASFPSLQRLAEHTKLVLAVRNTGTRTIPDVTVTICNVTCSYHAPVGEGTSVAAFAEYLNMPGLANHSRPVWIIDRAPGPCGYSCAAGGAGADVSSDANTWQGGSLRPGATATFVWGVTAVAPGRHFVAWEVDASLYGRARAILPDGSTPEGTFTVTISSTPAQSYVNVAGQIVRGTGQ